ncbi:MAG: methyltransferase domain-containing protein [Gammaproteobacteria bacterium]|nr:methyltransferase domain-containing protein [Gammaproteobacteria bacterium]MYB38718.1 methyltransferase domain-containing protein [Gammaproteobacteria bacterium]
MNDTVQAGQRPQLDRDRLEAFIKQIGSQVAAGFNCSLSHLGDRLGLYRALAEAGPMDSDELATHTGLHERWLREWLRHQACVQQVEYEDGRFSLSPEAAAVLAEEGHPFFFASGFGAVTATYPSLPKMPEVFETGLGLTYDDHGAACACGVERMSSFVQKHELVPKILPQVEGMVERLEAGARVADVGCGAGTATVAMAEAFPNSTFVGYDTSKHALNRAGANCAASAATNVRVANPDEEPMGNGQFDLVATFDVVHDTSYPDRLIAAVFNALKPDGAWLCADINSFPTFEQNLAEHPNAAMLYGFSVLVCMSASLSTPDGAGLGTLGFNEQVAREMTAAAGFQHFTVLEYGNAINSYYDIRP